MSSVTFMELCPMSLETVSRWAPSLRRTVPYVWWKRWAWILYTGFPAASWSMTFWVPASSAYFPGLRVAQSGWTEAPVVGMMRLRGVSSVASRGPVLVEVVLDHARDLARHRGLPDAAAGLRRLPPDRQDPGIGVDLVDVHAGERLPDPPDLLLLSLVLLLGLGLDVVALLVKGLRRFPIVSLEVVLQRHSDDFGLRGEPVLLGVLLDVVPEVLGVRIMVLDVASTIV